VIFDGFMSVYMAADEEKEKQNKLLKSLDENTELTMVELDPKQHFTQPPAHYTEASLVKAMEELGIGRPSTYSPTITTIIARRYIVKEGKNLPILTSCCPGWINFLEHHYPDLLDIPSSCKSPQQMFGAVAKTYYAEKIGVDPKDLVVVSIMPCQAKKYEAGRPEFEHNGIKDVDYVVTTRELVRMFREGGINLANLEDAEYDNPLGESTGAAVIFGVTGGVLEAALRSVYWMLNGKNLEGDAINFRAVRGLDGVKEAKVDVAPGVSVNVAVCSGLGNARKVLDMVRADRNRFQAIEIMACPGGCINGGGQPYINGDRKAALAARMEGIYAEDAGKEKRLSHENADVKKLYEEFLGEPGSEKAHHLLHTHYCSNARD
jgi:NADH-quinone oxidoreductase subunit G